ncbi:hypothetical protein [Streptomyces pactum]|uniref:Uncharacterized protein n=1 Tax=Streptomyces pactum TaxID=68249 RepID=A0A1S6J5B7_9ACTN|nr:hypothetical protein [Streptomyces pactum]AQS66891.1 hypothetical protein B1H29_08110 [Streptomyces pactum]
MADELVLRAHDFIDTCDVAGIPTGVKEGITGLGGSLYALTCCLQHELDLTALSHGSVRPHIVRGCFGA